MNNPLLEFKSWDSAFFNQAIYQMDATHACHLEKECFADMENALIQSKVFSDEVKYLDVLQQLGFVFVESEISFTYNLSKKRKPVNTVVKLERATLQDIPQIIQLASHSFIHTRFRTPWFKETDASLFYAEWAKKAVLHEYDDVCLKIEQPLDGTLCGIITAKRINDNEARIGLIGVAKEYQGKGIGTELLSSIEQWCKDEYIKTIEVATQGSNQNACAFYLRNQYQLNAINYWFYKRVP